MNQKYYQNIYHANVVCFGLIPKREGSISPAYFHLWLPDYLSHVFSLSALVMDKFLCNWYCLSECRYYVDVNQIWPRVYVTTMLRGMLLRVMIRWSVNRVGIGWPGSRERWATAHGWYHVD